MEVVRTVEALRRWRAAQRAVGRRVALVPTMGALHEGHLSLVDLASRDGHAVVMSIFVNPTQFGEGEDFQAYPRDESADVAMAAERGVACVFAPSAAEIYPPGFATTITLAGVTDRFEGAARPGHFDGVATVVAKLLLAALPDRAVFGAKDAQQFAVIRRLVHDLHIDLELIEAPIVREDDGLAMSSRNRYLDTDERRAATAISRGLFAAAHLAAAGHVGAGELIGAARAEIDAEPRCATEYVALVDAEDFTPLAELGSREARLCAAARVGPARLIDNVPLRAAGP